MLKCTREFVRNQCDLYFSAHAFIEGSGVECGSDRGFNVPLQSLPESREISPLKEMNI